MTISSLLPLCILFFVKEESQQTPAAAAIQSISPSASRRRKPGRTCVMADCYGTKGPHVKGEHCTKGRPFRVKFIVLAGAVACSIFASLSLYGSEPNATRTFGDASLRDSIAARCPAIYEAVNKPGTKRVFVLTRRNPMSIPGAIGAEATGEIVDGVLNRIVASASSKRGKYSVEYYLTKDGLLFVYESFAFFEDTSPRAAWRNWMGLAGWERRSYFGADHNIVYAETIGGGPQPGSDSTRLNEQARSMIPLVQEQDHHQGNTQPAQDRADAPGGRASFKANGTFAALVVTDLDASLRWYQSNLDLHVVKRGVSPRVAAEIVVLGGHNVFIELIHFTDRSLSPRVIDDHAPLAGPVKVGMIVGQKDFDAITERLHQSGVSGGVFQDKEMEVRSAIFKDNDGNLIQFFTGSPQ